MNLCVCLIEGWPHTELLGQPHSFIRNRCESVKFLASFLLVQWPGQSQQWYMQYSKSWVIYEFLGAMCNSLACLLDMVSCDLTIEFWDRALCYCSAHGVNMDHLPLNAYNQIKPAYYKNWQFFEVKQTKFILFNMFRIMAKLVIVICVFL